MKRLFGAALDFLFPPKCAFCHRVLDPGAPGVCDDCAKTLLQLEPITRTGEFFSDCVAAFPYEGVVRDSIRRYKFSGRQEYAKLYAPLLAARIFERLSGRFDLIAWAPVSRRRRRQRGYDQAELLARQTAALLHTPVCAALEKTRHTPAQSILQKAEQRRANVLGAYQTVQAETIAGRRILLIDDVITTGSTLSECSRVLYAAGAVDVVCAVLAAAGQAKG